MACEACERIAHYMAADPEMYRGEEAICSAHRRIRELETKPSEDEIAAVFDEWFQIRWKRLTKADRENPAFRNLSRLAFEAGMDYMQTK